MSRWEQLRDEMSRTAFHGQLDIDGGVQDGDVVAAKKRAVRSVGGADRTASSVAGHDDPTLLDECDTP